MTSLPFIPEPDSMFLIWLDNFRMKLPEYKVPFGIADAELTTLNSDYTWLNYTLGQIECFRTDTSERVAYKNHLRDGPVSGAAIPFPTMTPMDPPDLPAPVPGIEPRVRALIQRIKSHANYTEAIGQDLGIIGAAVTPDTSPKPGADAKALANSQVKITYFKGPFSAAVIESRRGNEVEWTSLGVKMKSQWVDKRPPLAPGQPELRYYRVRYVVDDEPVGEYSDVLTVTTLP